MTDYCENIVKVFLPEHLADLAPQLIIELATPGVVEGTEAEWMSFERLLPLPALFEGDDIANEIDAATSANAGRLHYSVDWPSPAPVGSKAITEHLKSLSNQHARAVDVVKERFRLYGVPTRYEWQMTRWGSKWLAMPGDPPQTMNINDMPGGHQLYGMDDSTVISWRFTTANSPPVGYISALARLCVASGFGMKAWFSGSDDYQFNPQTNDVELVWTEMEDQNVEIGETSAVRRLELSGGINIEPDEMAERRIEQRDPMFVVLE